MKYFRLSITLLTPVFGQNLRMEPAAIEGAKWSAPRTIAQSRRLFRHPAGSRRSLGYPRLLQAGSETWVAWGGSAETSAVHTARLIR